MHAQRVPAFLPVSPPPVRSHALPAASTCFWSSWGAPVRNPLITRGLAAVLRDGPREVAPGSGRSEHFPWNEGRRVPSQCRLQGLAWCLWPGDQRAIGGVVLPAPALWKMRSWGEGDIRGEGGTEPGRERQWVSLMDFQLFHCEVSLWRCELCSGFPESQRTDICTLCTGNTWVSQLPEEQRTVRGDFLPDPCSDWFSLASRPDLPEMLKSASVQHCPLKNLLLF